VLTKYNIFTNVIQKVQLYRLCGLKAM